MGLSPAGQEAVEAFTRLTRAERRTETLRMELRAWLQRMEPGDRAEYFRLTEAVRNGG